MPIIFHYLLLNAALIKECQSFVLLEVFPEFPLNEVTILALKMVKHGPVLGFSFLQIVFAESVVLGFVDNLLRVFYSALDEALVEQEVSSDGLD